MTPAGRKELETLQVAAAAATVALFTSATRFAAATRAAGVPPMDGDLDDEPETLDLRNNAARWAAAQEALTTRVRELDR